jgi:hypothetical protein
MSGKMHAVRITALSATLALAVTQAFAGSVTRRYVRDRYVADSNVVDTGQVDGRYTCTLNIPWDWPHRCPPLAPARPPAPPFAIPYAPPCPGQTVTMPGRDGRERTITIARC